MTTVLPPPRPPARVVGKLGKYEQRTLLDGSEIPPAGFVQAFRASHQLSKALDEDRQTAGNGQVAYLRKKQQQLAYVEAARSQPKPPLEAIAAPDLLRSELRRDAADFHGAAAPPQAGAVPGAAIGESASYFERRLLGQKEFLASRKIRHDAAIEVFERGLDGLSDDCQREAQAATERLRLDLVKSDAKIDELLQPLEPTQMPPKEADEGDEESESIDLGATAAELSALAAMPLDGTMEPAKAKALSARRSAQAALMRLGERPEAEVRGILSSLEEQITLRRQRLEGFAGEGGELARLDAMRKHRSEELLKVLVEAMTNAAHVVPGEAERLVEQRALALDAVLLENRRSVKILHSKLLVQTLEKSKDNKARWHKGLLLWKQQRHRHSLMLVMRRIRSDEFRQPYSIAEALGRVRSQQKRVFEERRELLAELFRIPIRKLTVVSVRSLEEQNRLLNDRAQEAFDALLAELKDLREALEVSAERMLGELGLELERHDARQEWKGFESVAELIDAEVRPPLRACLDQVKTLLMVAANTLTRQEEAQHHTITRFLWFFLSFGKKREQLSKRVEEFEVNYNGEVEDCEKDFEETCANYEAVMNQLHEAINDAAHHENLDDFKQKTFDHLDMMALGYRGNADQLLDIHERYPGEAAAMIRRETRGFCLSLGLALDPSEEAVALAEERRQAAAEAEAAAVALAGGDEPVEGEDDAAASARKAAVAAAREQARAAAQTLEAKALEEEAEQADLLTEASAWANSEGTGCTTLQRVPLDLLFQEIMVAPPLAGDDVGDGVEGVQNDSMQAKSVEEQDENVSVEEPRFADGTTALTNLHFDQTWVETELASTRSKVFETIAANKTYLDRVDIAAACEEVRRQLDQRLRRHTNRKGEIQVEWYVPRFSTISKHKDKFERHLIDIARKCQEQDESVDQILEQVLEEENMYKQKLLDLQGRLGEAETLPVLTAFERQANDLAASLKDCCKNAVQRLLDLSTKATQALQKENKAFLTMCRSSDEQYSESEMQFYSGEVEELNSSLEQRAQQRAQKARELEGQIDEKQKVPLKEFSDVYAKAVEVLCASKGYGRKYGEPRRKAQERVRTLIARTATVRQNIQVLLDYVQKLCLLAAPTDGGLEFSQLPRPPAAVRLREYFERAEEPWTFSGEVLGVLYVVVCAMSVIGTHLNAFKPQQATRYQLTAVPSFRILREDTTLMPPATVQAEVQRTAADLNSKTPREPRDPKDQQTLQEARSLQAEVALKDDCLLRVLGPVLRSEHFNAEVQSIVKASNDAYAGQAGGVPDFMTKFLGEMQQSSEFARQEASRCLRDWGTELREQTLLSLGYVLFGELTARALSELKRATKEAKQSSVHRWAAADSKRAQHEHRLNPSLANPNAEAELQALLSAEAARYEEAQAACAEDRRLMANALRSCAASFVSRLSSTSEESIALVDALPLHGHFAPLPGDEQMEPPRMSIKRRLRRLNASESAEATSAPAVPAPKGKAAPQEQPKTFTINHDGGDGSGGLPERQWTGLPRYDLRAQVLGNGWPDDPLLMKPGTEPETMIVDDTKIKELTQTLASFRSPVHRRLVECRSAFYDSYKAKFLEELQLRAAELFARETKEKAGESNWQSMVRQLRGEVQG